MLLVITICCSPQKDGVAEKCAKFIGERTDSHRKREGATFSKFIVEAAATL